MRSAKCTGNLTVADMRGRGWTTIPGLTKPRFMIAINKRFRHAVSVGETND